MTIADVIGGFVKGNIRTSVFEGFLYDNSDLIKEELSETLFLQMISLDYSDDNEVLHMKNVLAEHYGDVMQTYNDAFFETVICNAEPLHELIDCPPENETLVLDCGSISSGYELQSAIKRAFRFPDWYGMNWDAFNDLICLSRIGKIVLDGFDAMKQMIPDDAEKFLEIIYSHDTGSCEVVIK